MDEVSIRLYFMPRKCQEMMPFLLQIANYYGMRGVGIKTVRFYARSMDIIFVNEGISKERIELAKAYTLEEIREKYSEQWDLYEA
jgi:hypothetical protein